MESVKQKFKRSKSMKLSYFASFLVIVSCSQPNPITPISNNTADPTSLDFSPSVLTLSARLSKCASLNDLDTLMQHDKLISRFESSTIHSPTLLYRNGHELKRWEISLKDGQQIVLECLFSPRSDSISEYAFVFNDSGNYYVCNQGRFLPMRNTMLLNPGMVGTKKERGQ